MRTTLAVDDRLLESAKRRAKERDETLGEYVEEALRLMNAWLDRPRPRRAPALPVSSASGGFRPEFVGLPANEMLAKLDEDLPWERQR